MMAPDEPATGSQPMPQETVHSETLPSEAVQPETLLSETPPSATGSRLASSQRV